MAYFETRDLAGITIFAALWGILNSTMSPIFFRIFHLPFLCDLVGFACIILAVWWVRKFGTATMTGVIATIINLMIRPEGTHFFGFTAASGVFDVLASLVGHKRLFQNRRAIEYGKYGEKTSPRWNGILSLHFMVKEETEVETKPVTDMETDTEPSMVPIWRTEKSGIPLPMRCRCGSERLEKKVLNMCRRF